MAKRNRPRKKKVVEAIKEPDRRLSLKETHINNGGNNRSWNKLLYSLKPGQGLKHRPNRKKIMICRHNLTRDMFIN